MKSALKDIRRIGSLSIRSIAFIHLFTSTFFEISQTEGASMLPTVQMSGDFCIVDKRFKNGNGVNIGDVIVASKPTQPDNWVCKRITGMPGDIVIIDPSRNSLNSLKEKLDNSNDGDLGNLKEIKPVLKNNINNNSKGYDRSPYDQFIIVPDGHVWLTGDNLSDSIDSRMYSVLPMGLIGGKIIVGMYYPNWTKFKGNYFRFLENTFTEV